MTLRGRFVAYLVATHLLFAGVAAALLLRSPYWLFLVELAFLVSLGLGIWLSKALFRNLAFAREGLRLIREHEFTTRFLEVGQPEIDELIGVYNRMVDNLRDERIRLQEQHHFLAQILRVSPAGVVILDFDRRISDVNPAAERLIGNPAATLAGMRLEDLGSPLGEALAALPAGGAQVVSVNGARRVKCDHGTFLDRGFPRSFCLIQELTEELHQFERAAYEKLIRVMSHEVNNSVAASNSLLHSCLTYGAELRDGSRADFEDAIGIVIDRTEQLNTFMRRFADVFRLPPPVRQPCTVLHVLEGVVRLMSARPEAAGITWRWQVADPALRVPMDRGQMEQAFLNIVKNAVEAAGDRGTIAIRIGADNGRPEVTIEDSGPGLSREVRTHLFTPFFSTKPNGQGIGLTLVQEILSAHGFAYSLESAPGEPTRFVIRF